MKAAKAIALSLAVLLGVAVTADAFARGRHHHGGHHHRHGGVGFGLFIGAPAFGYYPSPYYYPPYSPYYYPQTVVVPSSPPVYVEQSQVDAPAPTQPQAGYWYYCRQSNAYYPYVEQCADPWERVPPRPAS